MIKTSGEKERTPGEDKAGALGAKMASHGWQPREAKPTDQAAKKEMYMLTEGTQRRTARGKGQGRDPGKISRPLPFARLLYQWYRREA